MHNSPLFHGVGENFAFKVGGRGDLRVC